MESYTGSSGFRPVPQGQLPPHQFQSTMTMPHVRQPEERWESTPRIQPPSAVDGTGILRGGNQSPSTEKQPTSSDSYNHTGALRQPIQHQNPVSYRPYTDSEDSTSRFLPRPGPYQLEPLLVGPLQPYDSNVPPRSDYRHRDGCPSPLSARGRERSQSLPCRSATSGRSLAHC